MKFSPVFVIFFIFRGVESFPRDLKDKAMRAAFRDISEALAKRNHLVSVVVDSASENKAASDPLASTADIPHIITKFDITSGNFSLNSSAIIFLDSVA